MNSDEGQYSLQSLKSLESEVITMIGHFLSNNHLLSPRSLLKIVLLQHPVGHLGNKTHKKSFKKRYTQSLPQCFIFFLSDNNFLVQKRLKMVQLTIYHFGITIISFSCSLTL